LNGSSPQYIFGSGTVSNLELNNSIGANIGSGDPFKLTGLLTLTSGTLTTNNKLVLKSTSPTATAMVGPVPASGAGISGNVVQERSMSEPSGVGNSGRAWRLVSFPGIGSSNNSIFNNWQNNGTTTSGRGVEIWSPGGTGAAGNGLAVGPLTSMRTYNNATNTYAGVTNTKSETLFGSTSNKAFLLFVSGHYNSGYIASGADPTTLVGTSNLLTGTQTYTFTAPNATNIYQLIGNPYACPIDFDKVYLNTNTANINRKFWTIDPNLNTIGAYVTVTWDGVSGYTVAPASAQNQYIQTGQAFFVEALTPNTLSTVEIQENDKETNAAQTAVFRTNGGNMETFRINLKKSFNNNYGMIDGTLVNGHQNLSNTIGSGDATKFGNFNENISIWKGNNTWLAIEGRQLLDNNDTVAISVSNMQQTNYQLEFEPGNMNVAGLSATLIDNFANTTTPISLTANTAYSFSVTSNSASTGTNRFRVVFNNTTPLDLKFVNVRAEKKEGKVNVSWVVNNEEGIHTYEVERSNEGKAFSKQGAVSSEQKTEYSFNDETPLSGNNYYRIKAIARSNSGVYSNIVKVNMNQTNTELSTYPNPAKGNNLQISVSNLTQGNYFISIYNISGQKVASKQINYEGGSSMINMNIENLTPGIYMIQLMNERAESIGEQKLVRQ
ncbi:MAG TPA: T9SS type A sorting domain-containing protein, partial [Flavipsychrobacter sp.]|nr:T9SS type A sorting domain-containing protein [Flavipsychrobacter sp.]